MLESRPARATISTRVTAHDFLKNTSLQNIQLKINELFEDRHQFWDTLILKSVSLNLKVNLTSQVLQNCLE